MYQFGKKYLVIYTMYLPAFDTLLEVLDLTSLLKSEAFLTGCPATDNIWSPTWKALNKIG